jgi:DNA-binding LacI/PurR family transcriptional regulator
MALKAKDIAEMLGVSTATISLVLNNKAGVGEQRRREIIRKIKELGCDYMLKNDTNTNGSIGFVVYKRKGSIVDESPFFTCILEGINHRVSKNGYTLSFIHIDKKMSNQEKENQIKNSNCAGLIIFAVEMKADDLQIFKESGLPFVLLDNSFQENDVDAVAINNAQGTSKAITHLYEMGHRTIGYIRSKVRITSFDERYTMYKSKLKQLGIEFKREYIIDVDYSENEVKSGIMEYLKKQTEPPTAFLAENDLIGCSAIRGFQEFGLLVPEDISVVGFDNRPISEVIQPSLTTINIPKDIFGPTSVDLLISKMESQREQSLKIEVGTNLVKRKSVKKIS